MFNCEEIHNIVKDGQTQQMLDQLKQVINTIAWSMSHSINQCSLVTGESRGGFRASMLKHGYSLPSEPLITYNIDAIRKTLGDYEKAKQYMVKMLERLAINEALIITRGNQTKAAQLLGVCRTTLQMRIKR